MKELTSLSPHEMLEYIEYLENELVGMVCGEYCYTGSRHKACKKALEDVRDKAYHIGMPYEQ